MVIHSATAGHVRSAYKANLYIAYSEAIALQSYISLNLMMYKKIIGFTTVHKT